MNKISPVRFGWAFGVTFSLLYVGCVIVMAVAGRDGTVALFNSLLHGLDVNSVVRMNVPMGETAAGLILTFPLAWFVGAAIAAVYNFTDRWFG